MQQKNKNDKLANFLVATGNITMGLGCLVMLMFGCTDAPTTHTEDTISLYGAAAGAAGAFLRIIGERLQEKNK
ncbi:MAG: hypothetical protein J6Y07_03270 [Alphaproteobacteria bacterium]|nr:hypothetical protein [Alphaproteobacteria bacterium]